MLHVCHHGAVRFAQRWTTGKNCKQDFYLSTCVDLGNCRKIVRTWYTVCIFCSVKMGAGGDSMSKIKNSTMIQWWFKAKPNARSLRLTLRSFLIVGKSSETCSHKPAVNNVQSQIMSWRNSFLAFGWGCVGRTILEFTTHRVKGACNHYVHRVPERSPVIEAHVHN